MRNFVRQMKVLMVIPDPETVSEEQKAKCFRWYKQRLKCDSISASDAISLLLLVFLFAWLSGHKF